MKNTTKLKRHIRKQTTGWRLARNYLILVSLVLLGSYYDKLPVQPIISPIAEAREPAPKPTEVPKKKEVDYSDLVEKYAQKYAKDEYQRYKLIYQLHCLLWHESNHYLNKGYGDDGKAGGPLQYWQGTWVSFRKQMIKLGLITEIGDRENPEQAIETTAFALSRGYGDNWGPIKRGECR